jgi:hypothetical protein
LVIAAVVTILGVAVSGVRGNAQPPEAKVAPATATTAETVDPAAWQKFDYTDLRSADFDKAWSNLNQVGPPVATPTEYKKFLADSAAFLKIFASENAPDQLVQCIDKANLKLPPPIAQMKEQFKAAGMLKNDSPLGVMQAIFGSVSGRQLIGVAVPNSSVRMFTGNKASSPVDDLGLHIVIPTGMSVINFSSTFSHKYNYLIAYEGGKTVTLADLKFYANETGKTPVGQLLTVRFWLDDQTHEWVPIASAWTETSEDSSFSLFVP